METVERGREAGSVRLNPYARREKRPDPNDVRAACPCCGSDVVSHWFYVPSHGYVLRWLCWESMGDSPTCDYLRVI